MATTTQGDTIDLKTLHLKQEQELLSKLASDLLSKYGTGTAEVSVARRPNTTRVILTWTYDRGGDVDHDLRRVRQLPNPIIDQNPTMRCFALTEAVATMCKIMAPVLARVA